MSRNIRLSIVIVLSILIIVGIFTYRAYHAYQTSGQNTSISNTVSSTTPNITSNASNDEISAIRDLVNSFGTQLQMVSLAAPKDIAAQAIQDNYSPYVTADLLAQWKANPSKAPGRQTSSPWPDHIQISSITKNPAKNPAASNQFTVTGSVIELTSNEVEYGGIADSYPITLTIQNQNGVWIITAVTLAR